MDTKLDTLPVTVNNKTYGEWTFCSGGCYVKRHEDGYGTMFIPTPVLVSLIKENEEVLETAKNAGFNELQKGWCWESTLSAAKRLKKKAHYPEICAEIIRVGTTPYKEQTRDLLQNTSSR